MSDTAADADDASGGACADQPPPGAAVLFVRTPDGALQLATLEDGDAGRPARAAPSTPAAALAQLRAEIAALESVRSAIAQHGAWHLARAHDVPSLAAAVRGQSEVSQSVARRTKWLMVLDALYWVGQFIVSTLALRGPDTTVAAAMAKPEELVPLVAALIMCAWGLFAVATSRRRLLAFYFLVSAVSVIALVRVASQLYVFLAIRCGTVLSAAQLRVVLGRERLVALSIAASQRAAATRAVAVAAQLGHIVERAKAVARAAEEADAAAAADEGAGERAGVGSRARPAEGGSAPGGGSGDTAAAVGEARPSSPTAAAPLHRNSTVMGDGASDESESEGGGGAEDDEARRAHARLRGAAADLRSFLAELPRLLADPQLAEAAAAVSAAAAAGAAADSSARGGGGVTGGNGGGGARNHGRSAAVGTHLPPPLPMSAAARASSRGGSEGGGGAVLSPNPLRDAGGTPGGTASGNAPAIVSAPSSARETSSGGVGATAAAPAHTLSQVPRMHAGPPTSHAAPQQSHPQSHQRAAPAAVGRPLAAAAPAVASAVVPGSGDDEQNHVFVRFAPVRGRAGLPPPQPPHPPTRRYAPPLPPPARERRGVGGPAAAADTAASMIPGWPPLTATTAPVGRDGAGGNGGRGLPDGRPQSS